MNENYSFQKSAPQNNIRHKDSFKSSKDLTSLFFLFFSLLSVTTGFSQTTVNITTTGAGTFTVPCDVTSITVQAWGGGGGGYGDNNNDNIVGHGGGGGAYTTATLAVTGGQVINFTVGAGGTAGSAVGGNGGSTTFLTLTAGGGTGGNVSSGGTGGTASGGTTNLSGGNGTAGTNPIGGAGGTGAGPGGGAGGTGGGNGVNGTNGSAIGGGGGASGDRSGGARTGGAGARGQITITYTSTLQTYCSPTFTTAIEPITNVTFAGINNTTSNTVNGSSALESFCYAATVMQGSTTNAISVKGNTDGNFTDYIRVYIDWDQNGTFGNNANEIYDLGTITNSTGVDAITLTSNITVPATASIGVTRMRVMKRYNAYPTGPCQTGTGYGQAEDYIVNVAAPLPCVTPTSQPTALSLIPTGATIAGSFTAASPAADNYLVLISTNSSAPSAPVNGTTYTIGSTYQTGYTVVDNDTNTTFTATGLTPLTTYYVYIYSFNSVCTGGPAYLGTSPLTGSTTTLTPDYCIPTISSTYQTSTTCHIRKVEFIGTLQDIVNTSSFPTVAPFGYENYTGLAVKSIQAKGEGVNIYMESPNSGYIKAWVDWNQDGDFLDAGETVYDAGGVSQASTTFGFIVPTGITAADYRVRLRISGRNSSMFGTDAGYSWDACSTNLNYYGEAEDYILRVIDNCSAKISSVTTGSVCGSGVVTLQATGTAGTTEFRWYSAETGGSLLGTTTSGSWDTPSISTTTAFWVTAYNGSCETLVRTKVTAFVKTVPTLTFATSATEICGENSIVALTAAGDTELIYLIDEHFESGLGTFTNVHYVSNAAVNSQTAWQTHTGPYIPTGLTWYPAISSGFGANSFAFVTSDIGGYYTGPNFNYYTINNGLVSSTINSTNFLNLTLTLRLYFDRYYPDGVNATSELMTIDVSTNGGTSWTSISGNITGDVGYGTKFSDMTYDLSAYINQSNLKIRVRYYSDTWANGAAVDDIQLFGTKALNTAFLWSGSSLPDAYLDAATTIPYTSGTSATTVYVKPTLTQLEMGSYTFTATATLSNGCDVSQDITITNKTSVWRGTNSNDWNNPNNWSPAVVPDINTCVIIPDVTSTNPSNILGSGFNAYGKTLNIKGNGILEITSGNTLTIQNLVDVNATGTFRIQNSGSLIQIDNVANTGNISMKRNVNIRKLDYVYWSSPVANFGLTSVSPTTTGFKYKWIPTISTNLNGFGNWSSTSETMVLGKGYIVRGPDNYTSTLQNFTATFTGVPNNGNLTSPISRGTYDGADYSTGTSTTLATKDDDNWNLLGNPYPSALHANSFLAANTNIAGFIKLWTHGTLPSAATADPFYQDFIQNYSVTDYVTYNYLGASTPYFDGNIASGQGFFVLMNHSGTAQNENVTFNNAMRSNTYRNDLFYRNDENLVSGQEKSRIWIDLISPSNIASRALIGYDLEATNSIDRLYDAMALGVKTNFEVYSLCNNERLSIQGRTFDQSDIVPIGLKTDQTGIYTIAINAVDGIFSDANQNIYLEDLSLGITHDLRSTPYSFTVDAAGVIDNRFNLRYTSNDVLNNQIFSSSENAVKIYPSGNLLQFDSSINNIKEIVIHDILGKMIFNKSYTEKSITVDSLIKTNSTIVIKVVLDDDSIVTKKVIF